MSTQPARICHYGPLFWNKKPTDRLSNNLEFISVAFTGLNTCVLTIHDHDHGADPTGTVYRVLQLQGRYDDDLLLDDPFCHGGIHSVRGRRYSAWRFRIDDDILYCDLLILCPQPSSLEIVIT